MSNLSTGQNTIRKTDQILALNYQPQIWKILQIIIHLSVFAQKYIFRKDVRWRIWDKHSVEGFFRGMDSQTHNIGQLSDTRMGMWADDRQAKLRNGSAFFCVSNLFYGHLFKPTEKTVIYHDIFKKGQFLNFFRLRIWCRRLLHVYTLLSVVFWLSS